MPKRAFFRWIYYRPSRCSWLGIPSTNVVYWEPKEGVLCAVIVAFLRSRGGLYPTCVHEGDTFGQGTEQLTSRKNLLNCIVRVVLSCIFVTGLGWVLEYCSRNAVFKACCTVGTIPTHSQTSRPSLCRRAFDALTISHTLSVHTYNSTTVNWQLQIYPCFRQ